MFFVFFSCRLVIHICMDGYTRKIIYLACRNNIRTTILYNLYSNLVQLHGLSPRVTGDQGKENIEVARFMLLHPLRGLGRESSVATKRVCNQRIEGLCIDVYLAFTQIYLTVSSFGMFWCAGCLKWIPYASTSYFCPGSINIWKNFVKVGTIILQGQKRIFHWTNYGFIGCTG